MCQIILYIYFVKHSFMKKIILLFLMPFFGFSQQIYKNITEDAVNVTVEFYVFRNGSSLNQIVGEQNFDCYGQNTYTFSNSSGTTITYPETYPATLTSVTRNMENICSNGSFYFNGGFSQAHYSYTSRPLTISNYFGDSIEDSNMARDILISKFIIPKTRPTGTPYPLDTWLQITSLPCFEIGQLYQNPFYGRIYLKYDGTTWVEQSVNYQNNPVPTIPSICSVTLNSSHMELNPDLFIFPNPAVTQITIQNLDSGKYAYQIIDLVGRIIKYGTIDFGVAINIEDLAIGNYIIKIKDAADKIYSIKFIKK